MPRDGDAQAGRTLLSSLTTIGLGGPAPAVYAASSAADVAELAAELDRSGGMLVLGGGSNLVVADEGIDVPVLRVAVRGVRVEQRGDATAVVSIGAGEDWDAVVAQLVAEGWCGPETLSGIPGAAGATPVQNVGAYGTEIADLLVDIEAYDRATGRMCTMTPSDLRLGYRSSVLRGTDRAIVTGIRLHLHRQPRPVRYAELARTLGVSVGDAAPAADVRSAVLELRRGKGMVLVEGDPDTRSVGSFFTNPIVGSEALAVTAAAVAARLGDGTTFPQYPAGAGQTKLSAAWLIERAGFAKGYPLAERPDATVAVSTKHTLALTNRGGGSTRELIALAREIQAGVRDVFGVTLQPEPVLVGIAW